jgi:hypothetical protein
VQSLVITLNVELWKRCCGARPGCGASGVGVYPAGTDRQGNLVTTLLVVVTRPRIPRRLLRSEAAEPYGKCSDIGQKTVRVN